MYGYSLVPEVLAADSRCDGMEEAKPFTFDGGRVKPGETRNVRYTVSETYLGDAVRMPVTIVNGERPGPTVFLTAAAHGDELNGIEVVREVAHEWNHDGLAGTLICLPVLNVPAFLAQERYLPIYDRDLNRSFPGDPESTSAKRMAHEIFRNFLAPCDVGLDFHTSTRGRTNMLHVRANMDDPEVARVANAFASNVIISSEGPSGSLRRELSDSGVPTITIEMGEATGSSGRSSTRRLIVFGRCWRSSACGTPTPSGGRAGGRSSTTTARKPGSARTRAAW